jgi:hypothetical protein
VFDQLDHGQQLLPVLAQKFGQLALVDLSVVVQGVVVSSHGGSPSKDSHPDSKQIGMNRRLTFHYNWDTLRLAQEVRSRRGSTWARCSTPLMLIAMSFFMCHPQRQRGIRRETDGNW